LPSLDRLTRGDVNPAETGRGYVPMRTSSWVGFAGTPTATGFLSSSGAHSVMVAANEQRRVHVHQHRARSLTKSMTITAVDTNPDRVSAWVAAWSERACGWRWWSSRAAAGGR
jgi:hypothetical protein